MSEEEKLLGKPVEYPTEYAPEILVAVPRSENRKAYGIKEGDNLFCGVDCWHCYECSFLLYWGMPVTGLLKIVYSSDSLYIVESKSLKLYLSSFNMFRLGNDEDDAIKEFQRRVELDLGKLLSTEVKTCFYRGESEDLPWDFDDYRIAEYLVNAPRVSVNLYKETPEVLLEDTCPGTRELRLATHLLKSNCKVTHQPDWGSVFVRMRAARHPSKESFLKYIASLREEYHFHEEICEMIYKRLWDLFSPKDLAVCCLYTRRGGIDICPCRASSEEYLPPYLMEADILTKRTFRQ